MNRILFLSLLTSLTSVAHAKLVVHEWGTFTSLVGSDGIAQNGMYSEDEALPDFVFNFGDSVKLPATRTFQGLRSSNCPGYPKVPCEYLEDQLITQKMETPVVYFYSDSAQKVNFDVSFPGGIISQSYPAPIRSLPEAVPGVELKNGFAHYEVEILKNSSAQPPQVEAANIYSHARNVASDLVRSGNEIEKFIFYRGLGQFQTKLLTTSQGGNLWLENKGHEKIPAAFLIYTDGHSRGDLLPLGPLAPGLHKRIDSLRIAQMQTTKISQASFLKSARQTLLTELTQAGLYQDEAKAMVDTWENGYFKTPGLRVLYILSDSEVDQILPVQISPRPQQFERVFVGRIELLLDTSEQEVLSLILRQRTNFDVATLGRLAYPILLRVRELARAEGKLTADVSSDIETLIGKIP